MMNTNKITLNLNTNVSGRELDYDLYKVLRHIEDALNTVEQELLEHRTIPCAKCDSTGKTKSTYDKMCPDCTPPHCIECGTTHGLTQVSSFYVCRKHLSEMGRE